VEESGAGSGCDFSEKHSPVEHVSFHCGIPVFLPDISIYTPKHIFSGKISRSIRRICSREYVYCPAINTVDFPVICFMTYQLSSIPISLLITGDVSGVGGGPLRRPGGRIVNGEADKPHDVVPTIPIARDTFEKCFVISGGAWMPDFPAIGTIPANVQSPKT
jgi:hypothetical protein